MFHCLAEKQSAGDKQESFIREEHLSFPCRYGRWASSPSPFPPPRSSGGGLASISHRRVNFLPSPPSSFHPERAFRYSSRVFLSSVQFDWAKLGWWWSEKEGGRLCVGTCMWVSRYCAPPSYVQQLLPPPFLPLLPLLFASFLLRWVRTTEVVCVHHSTVIELAKNEKTVCVYVCECET